MSTYITTHHILIHADLKKKIQEEMGVSMKTVERHLNGSVRRRSKIRQRAKELLLEEGFKIKT